MLLVLIFQIAYCLGSNVLVDNIYYSLANSFLEITNKCGVDISKIKNVTVLNGDIPKDIHLARKIKTIACAETACNNLETNFLFEKLPKLKLIKKGNNTVYRKSCSTNYCGLSFKYFKNIFSSSTKNQNKQEKRNDSFALDLQNNHIPKKLKADTCSQASEIKGKNITTESEQTSIFYSEAEYMSAKLYVNSKIVCISAPKLIKIDSNCFRDCSSLTTIIFQSLTQIGSNCFVNCDLLKDVTLPNLMVAGDECFSHCNSLVTVTFEKLASPGTKFLANCEKLNEVTLNFAKNLPVDSFYDCINLHTVNAPKLWFLIKNSFTGCTNLTKLIIPSATTIESNAIDSSIKLHILIIGTENTSFPNLGSTEELKSITYTEMTEVPDEGFLGIKLESIDLPKCTKIGVSGFMDGSATKTLNIPKLELINNSAFEGFDFGQSKPTFTKLTSIGDRAFANSKIGDVELIANEISDSAFEGSTITSIKLPFATKIGKNCFKNCSSLTTFEAPLLEEIPEGALDNCSSLINLIIPNVTTFSNEFNFPKLEKIIISIKEINNIEKLTTLTEGIFISVETIPKTLKDHQKLEILEFSIATAAEEGSIENMEALKTFIAPKLTKVSETIFDGCDALVNIDIGSIDQIINDNILNATNLSIGIQIDDIENFTLIKILTLTNVEEITIEDPFDTNTDLIKLIMPKLTSISIVDLAAPKLQTFIAPLLEEYNESIIPKTVTSLEVGRLDGLSEEFLKKLTKISMDTITEIVSSKYLNYTLLEDVEFPDVVDIKENAFSNCTSLKTAKIPLVKTIGERAFYNCTSLSDITFQNVENIGARSFQNCIALENLYLPKALSIPESAFEGCAKLKTVVLPNVGSIDTTSFNDCTSVESFEADSIDTFVRFDSFTNIKILSLPKLSKSLDVSKFNKLERLELGTPDVYETSKSTLKYINFPSATEMKVNFKDFAKLETVIIPLVTEVPESAFENCILLSELVTGNLTNIGSNAFANCELITEVNVTSALSIGEGSFMGCQSLIEFIAPNLTQIPAKAFQLCCSLKILQCAKVDTISDAAFDLTVSLWKVELGISTPSIEILGSLSILIELSLPNVKVVPESILKQQSTIMTLKLTSATTIESNALLECSNLRAVDIPSVSVIGSCAFQGCRLLKVVNAGAVSTVGARAFKDCVSLVNVTLSGAAASSSALSEETKKVGEGAFEGCTSLQYLVFDAATELVGDSHFANCIALHSIWLGGLETVSVEATKVFAKCQQLHRIFLPCSPPLTFYQYTFNDSRAGVDLELPADNCYFRYEQQTYNVGSQTFWAGTKFKYFVPLKNLTPGRAMGVVIGAAAAVVMISIAVFFGIRMFREKDEMDDIQKMKPPPPLRYITV